MTTHACGVCGVVYRHLPAAWSVFRCATCGRVWQRVSDIEWRAA